MSGERRNICRRHRVWRLRGVRHNKRGLEENSRESVHLSPHPSFTPSLTDLLQCILFGTRRVSSKWSVKRSGDWRDDLGRSESRFVIVCTSDKTDGRYNRSVGYQNRNSSQDNYRMPILHITVCYKPQALGLLPELKIYQEFLDSFVFFGIEMIS
jgi:hypothetical protein